MNFYFKSVASWKNYLSFLLHQRSLVACSDHVKSQTKMTSVKSVVEYAVILVYSKSI